MGISINSFAQHMSRLSAFGEKPTKQEPREFCAWRECSWERGQPSPGPLLGIHSHGARNAVTWEGGESTGGNDRFGVGVDPLCGAPRS